MLKDKIIKEMESGKVMKEVSAQFGIGTSRLYALAKLWEVKRPRGKYNRGPVIPPPEKATLVRLMMKHKFITAKVAAPLGVSGHTVRKWCLDYNIPLSKARAGREGVEYWDKFLSEN